jgi:hypothetical protein
VDGVQHFHAFCLEQPLSAVEQVGFCLRFCRLQLEIQFGNPVGKRIAVDTIRF